MAESRRPHPHCKYRVVWYDFGWNEIEATEKPMSASAMIEALERWNRTCQREARDTEMIVPRVGIPAYVSVEVIYVQG